MGVRAVKVFAGDKLVHTFSGGGGCCSAFQQSYTSFHPDVDCLEARFDCSYINDKHDSIFRSKMVQSLVPGCEWLPADSTGNQGLRVPFKDLPGDQVATVLRIAKNWFYGHYNSTLKMAKEQFPELEDHEQAVIAVVLRNSHPDSDGSVCFWSPTTRESLENHSKWARDYNYQWRLVYAIQPSSSEEYRKNSGIHAGSLLKLLRGEIKPGIQPAFKLRGYYKAGGFPSYHFQCKKDEDGNWLPPADSYAKKAAKEDWCKPYSDLDVEPTVNYPVIHRCWDTPLLISCNNPTLTELSAILAFRKWIDEEGIKIGEEVGKPLLEPAVEEPSVQLPTALATPSAGSEAKPKSSKSGSLKKTTRESTAPSLLSGSSVGRSSSGTKRSSSQTSSSTTKGVAPKKKAKAEPKRSSLDEIFGPEPF